MVESIRAQKYNPVSPFAFEVTGGPGMSGTLGFSRVSGLGGEIGVKEWRQMTDPATPIKLPMETAYGSITLERGLDMDGTLWGWWEAVHAAVRTGAASFPRYTLTITAFGRPRTVKDQSITGRWEVFAAWPQSVKWGDLDAQTSGMLIESLVLANEGVQKL